MNKKIVFLFALALVFVVSGCSENKSAQPNVDSKSAQADAQPAQDSSKKQKIAMADVCNYFPKELIEAAIGKPVLKVEKPLISEDSCFYYTIYADDYDYSPVTGRQPGGAPVVVVLRQEDLAADKAAKEKTGNTFVKDESIKMDNYVVYNAAKKPWQVMLILTADQYVEMHFVHSAVTGDELVKIAAKFAEKIQGN